MARKIIISEYIEDILPEIGDAEAGWILRAVFAMNGGKDPGDPPEQIRIAWKGIRRQQESMIAKYEATCAKRSSAGRAGNASRWKPPGIANAINCDNGESQKSQMRCGEIANAINCDTPNSVFFPGIANAIKEKEREKETNTVGVGGADPVSAAVANVGASAAALARNAAALSAILAPKNPPKAPVGTLPECPPAPEAAAKAAESRAGAPAAQERANAAPDQGSAPEAPENGQNAAFSPPGAPTPAKNTRKTAFVSASPPSVEQVREYCRERANAVDAERFVAYYTANGWRVGKNPMRDWRAAVRTWERGDSTPHPAYHLQTLQPMRETALTAYREPENPNEPKRNW